VKIHPGDLMLEDVLFSCGEEKSALLLHLAACSYCRTRLRKLPAEIRRQIAAAIPTLALDPPSDGLQPQIRREFISLSARQADAAAYGAILERSERSYLERAKTLHKERAQAGPLLDELLAHEPKKRSLLLGNSPRFHTWGLYELILERSWILRGPNPAQAEELCKLALELSARLDTGYYSAELIEDLRARAWSYLGNLRRIASDLDGAERAFEACYAHLKRGTREPIERAMYLDLKASLRRAQRHFDEAIRLLKRAADIFLRHGDRHRAGRSLVNLSTVFESAGQTEQAISILRQAVDLVDPAADERLLLSASHNLICCLVSLERFIEAQGLYRDARQLYARYETAGFGTRRLWVKGQIERGLGQIESAESLLLAARNGFLEADIPYEAALVSLDLAVLYAEQSRTDELKQMATEMLPIFTSLGIQREALAALMFLKRAADAERLSVEVAGRVADFLRRAQNDPTLKFEAPAELSRSRQTSRQKTRRPPRSATRSSAS
jgi:tetratricopeptide (TPR) repeat protein